MPMAVLISKLQRNKIEPVRVQTRPIETLLARNAPAWKIKPTKKEIK